MLDEKKRSKSDPAYFVVDISKLEPELQAAIIEDAALGGGVYGVRVVEEVHNGPARAVVYGVYYNTQAVGDAPGITDEDLWNDAKQAHGISDEAEGESAEEAARATADRAAAEDAIAAKAAEDEALRRAGVDPDAKPNKNPR